MNFTAPPTYAYQEIDNYYFNQSEEYDEEFFQIDDIEQLPELDFDEESDVTYNKASPVFSPNLNDKDMRLSYDLPITNMQLDLMPPFFSDKKMRQRSITEDNYKLWLSKN